nr:MAG TPA: hypothetical protein [Caudoviricetes sp.]
MLERSAGIRHPAPKGAAAGMKQRRQKFETPAMRQADRKGKYL